MKLDRNHVIHYLIIIGIVALGLSIASLFSGNKMVQFIGFFATACGYVGYAIVHHRLEHDLTIKIVIEYILIGLLPLVLFLFVKGGM
jgi:hypothetical protein